jgi:16S rRNA A1518/A1519 N6-dimethyltransferase RsmA/KsgA/DIM1 with predicted DNA glycosylase/AP lyase activity
MQTKEELEKWYAIPDPWMYLQTEDDIKRKNIILDLLNKYKRALDIGCGEGFITTDLPAIDIHGIEISDNAAHRLPWNVKRVHQPEGVYDLVMTTGTLYQQYNHAQIAEWIRRAASRHVLIAGIKDWLVPYNFGTPIASKEFKYREYTQSVILYEVSA